MKTSHQENLWRKLAVIIPASFIILTLLSSNMTNSAETIPSHADPKLRTRWYSRQGDWNTIQRVIEQTIPAMTTYGRHWRLMQTQPAKSPDWQMIIQVEVPVIWFTDDLQVRVQLTENGEAWRVNVRSVARVGKSDLGENRRHVRQLLEALDKQLP